MGIVLAKDKLVKFLTSTILQTVREKWKLVGYQTQESTV